MNKYFFRSLIPSHPEAGHRFLRRELGRRVPQLGRQRQERGRPPHHDRIQSQGDYFIPPGPMSRLVMDCFNINLKKFIKIGVLK
jgi:hypothetical protein